MILTLIIFLPFILTTIWVNYRSIRRHILSTAICMSVFALLFLCHMLYLTDYWYLGHHEWNTMSRIDCWLYPFIVPTLYVFTCYKTGTRRAMLDGISMLAFALLNFSSGIIINIKGGITPELEEPFLMTITWGETILAVLPVQEFVLAIQALWFITRILNYSHVMKREKTHLSKESIVFGKSIIFAALLGITGTFMPGSWFDRTWTFFLLAHIPISLAITYCMYLIGKGYLLTPIVDENNEQAISTITENKIDVFNKIDNYIKESKCFLNSELLISDVAHAVDTNRLYVSGAIQEITGDNFNAYINSFRVKAAKDMIIHHPSIKLDNIAAQCGFGSASSFTKIFKKYTGQTPSELRSKIRSTQKTHLHML